MTTWTSIAQIKVTGVVKDSIGTPLEMANVIAINKKTKKLDSYGFTDAKGNYLLSLKKNSSYTIKISYIGKKPSENLLNTKETAINKDFVLLDDATLDEVNISYKMPVTIKGDTIVYNADSFTTGTEGKLGDVLKKLPGVNVNEDGEIEVEGKKVKKVMVEGKNFFEGDSKLATKNIPADAVDKIEVLKNHSEVSQLSSVTDNEDNVVINLKLKEGKKNFWFGEVEGGSGIGMLEERYTFNPKLFYYSPKYSLNIITDINNVGKAPFTIRDYIKFSGGFKNLMRGSGTSFTLDEDLSLLTLQNDRIKAMKAKFGAVNFSYSPKKEWDINGFAIYSGNETNAEQLSNSIYTNTTNSTQSNSLIIKEESVSNLVYQENNLGLFKIGATYKPNSENQLNYDVFTKVSGLKKVESTISSRSYFNNQTERVPVNQILKQSPFSLSQNLNYYYTLNEKNIFSFEAQHLWKKKDPFYNAELEQLSFANLIGVSTVNNIFNVGQSKLVTTNRLENKLDYYRVINDRNSLNVTIGGILNNQQFNSTIFEILNGNKKAVKNENSNNDVDFSFRDIYIGLNYRFITGAFTFNQGITFHKYLSRNTQLGLVAEQRFVQALPKVSIKFKLKNSETLRLRYNMQTDFSDVEKLAENYVLNNYSSLYAGNRNLENTLSHNLNLSYQNFNRFNYTNIFGSINYNKKINSITSNTKFLGVNIISSSVNSMFPDETVSANINFQKDYRKFKISLGGDVNYSKLNSLVRDIFTDRLLNRLTKSFTQFYKTKFSTNLKDAPNFDIAYNVAINKTNINGIKNTYTTHSPYINFEAFFFKSFSFSTKYTYNHVLNNSRAIDSYGFLKADLIYRKKNSKWEYKLTGTNLLDTKSLNRNFSNDLLITNSSYLVQPRIVTLNVKYSL
ncbi:CarboxypepD_reg-like domain-containing protein [Tenacibaculum sp. 190524A02b]|uniref:CarboxypepD_reg-like domain-containing protein n=2 Tax=Tenacibaculum vairaonense TaxID=3137860 RepID=A0ABP1FJ53_9FLAO